MLFSAKNNYFRGKKHYFTDKMADKKTESCKKMQKYLRIR